MKFKLVNIIYLLALIGSCKGKENGTQGESFSKFPNTDNVLLTDYMLLDTSVAHDRIFLTDTSILIVNLGKLVKNYLFYEYSIKSKKQVGKYIKWGTGKNKIYGTISHGLYKNDKLWIHDLSLEKVLVASLKSKVSSDSLKEITEFSTPGFMYSAQLIDSNRLIQSGLYSIPDYLQILDLPSSKPLAQIGRYIPPNTKYHPNTWKSAYESFLFVHPAEKRAALASRYSDRVIVFDLTTGKYRIINGPQNFEPKFESHASYKTKFYGITRTKETTFAYIGGATSSRYLYLLFSGRKEGEKDFFRSNSVFVYDWNGSPVRKINLNKFIESIAVTDDDKWLYSIDPEKGKVVVAALN